MQFTPTQKRASAWCLIAALIVLALWLLGPVLTPFVVAAVLAYALTPLVNKLDAMGKGRVPRVLAVVVVELLFIVVALSLVLLIIPIVAKEIPLMREQVPLLFDKLNTGLNSHSANTTSEAIRHQADARFWVWVNCIEPLENRAHLQIHFSGELLCCVVRAIRVG